MYSHDNRTRDCNLTIFAKAFSRDGVYLADAVEALALTELVLDLPCTLFGLFQAAHSVRLLTVTEVNVAQVKICTVEILQQITLPLQD